jgi:hypothetical protein
LRTRESAFLLSLLFSFQRPNGPLAGSRPPAARRGDGKLMYRRAKVNKKAQTRPVGADDPLSLARQELRCLLGVIGHDQVGTRPPYRH